MKLATLLLLAVGLHAYNPDCTFDNAQAQCSPQLCAGYVQRCQRAAGIAARGHLNTSCYVYFKRDSVDSYPLDDGKS